MNNPIWPFLGVLLIIGISYLFSEIEEKNNKNKRK